MWINAKQTAVTAAGISQADSLRQRSGCGMTLFHVRRDD
jgi:hypothetical protein